MPSGRRIIGRHHPTTPGSNTLGQERTSTSPRVAKRELERTAARIRNQLRTRTSTIAAKPQIQTESSAMPVQSRAAGAGGIIGTVPENGSLIWTIRVETAGVEICVAIFCAAGVHSI